MKILTNENYKEVIKEGKVIVDFWATWCGPCRMAKPKFETLEESHKDYKFCEANVDECNQFADEMKISNVPTFIIFEDGKEVKRGGINLLSDYL